MTPFASVAILEKLALLKIALCRAPVVSRASVCRRAVFASGAIFRDKNSPALRAVQQELCRGAPCPLRSRIQIGRGRDSKGLGGGRRLLFRNQTRSVQGISP